MKKLVIILGVVAALALLGTCAYRGVTAGLEGWAKAQESTGAAIEEGFSAYGVDWDMARLTPYAAPTLLQTMRTDPIAVNGVTEMLRRYVGPMTDLDERACTNFSSGTSTESGRYALATCYAVASGETGTARFDLTLSHDGEVWRFLNLHADVTETSVEVAPAAPLPPRNDAATPETAPSAN